MESLTINALSDLLSRNAEGQLSLSSIVGFCHSYDYDSDLPNLRRIRVTYPNSKGGLSVSPLLWRIVNCQHSDPPVPTIGDLVFGFWLNADHTEGVYLGVFQNAEPAHNESSTHDTMHTDDEGIYTIRAREIRLIATDRLTLTNRVKEEGYTEIDFTEGNEIQFRDYSGLKTIEQIERRLTALEEAP